MPGRKPGNGWGASLGEDSWLAFTPQPGAWLARGFAWERLPPGCGRQPAAHGHQTLRQLHGRSRGVSAQVDRKVRRTPARTVSAPLAGPKGRKAMPAASFADGSNRLESVPPTVPSRTGKEQEPFAMFVLWRTGVFEACLACRIPQGTTRSRAIQATRQVGPHGGDPSPELRGMARLAMPLDFVWMDRGRRKPSTRFLAPH